VWNWFLLLLYQRVFYVTVFLHHFNNSFITLSSNVLRRKPILTTFAINCCSHNRTLTNMVWLLSYIVELVVESAGVTNRLPVRVPSPEGRLGRLAVCTRSTLTSCCTLLSWWKGKEKEKIFNFVFNFSFRI